MFQINVHSTFQLRWKEKAFSVLNEIATSGGPLPNLVFVVLVVPMLLKTLSKKGIEAQLLLKT